MRQSSPKFHQNHLHFVENSPLPLLDAKLAQMDVKTAVLATLLGCEGGGARLLGGRKDLKFRPRQVFFSNPVTPLSGAR